MKTEMTLKYILSVFLIMVGINKLFLFLPSMDLNSDASEFMGSLAESGYLLIVVGVTEILCGLMLSRKSTTPLGLLFLAPISVNIILFHIFLDPSTIWMALFVGTANVYLLYRNREFYAPVLSSVTNGNKISKTKIGRSSLSYGSE